MALPSSLSAFMGITEPAIFGVNLRFFRPFVCACIGGGCGAMFASITSLGATGTGVTGIFGILLCLNAPVKYILMFAISAGVAFALSWMFGYKNAPQTANGAPETATAFTEPKEAQGELNILSPMQGKAVSLADTDDDTFAAEILGKGAAIEPSEGKVYAPFDATVETLMGHAVGLTGENGVEMLIHIGIDTVQLNGKHYTPHCTEGQHVKAGDLLMEFDMAAIQAEGFKTITPVIVTNADDYADVLTHIGKQTKAGETLLTVKK